MSDDDRDIDIESDDGDDYLDGDQRCNAQRQGGGQYLSQFSSQAEKRAHHNALERKRRDHIKDSFSGLRDSVPALHGEKVNASRAQILKKAADYIQFMRRKNSAHQQDIEDLKKQNSKLESQIQILERNRLSGKFKCATEALMHSKSDSGSTHSRSGSDLSDASSTPTSSRRLKKIKSGQNALS